jgi:hypothetical protein
MFSQPEANSSDTIQNSLNEIPYMVLYGMSMDVRSAYDTIGTDYAHYLQKTTFNKNWNILVIEHSPSGATRNSESYDIDNKTYSSFFGNGTDEIVPGLKKGYVNFLFDLSKINYPDQYSLFFYTFDFFIKDGQLCRLADVTQTVFVPPPKFSISTIPASVELRPGEEKNVLIRLNANTTLSSPSQVLLYTNDTKGIMLNFKPNRTAIPSFGVTTSTLNIHIPGNMTPAPYTLPLFSNITIPMDIKPRRNSVTGEVLNSSPQTLLANSFITITVNEPMKWDERIKDFWDKLGSPITFIYGVIVATVPWVLNYLRVKFKNKGIRLDNWFNRQ